MKYVLRINGVFTQTLTFHEGAMNKKISRLFITLFLVLSLSSPAFAGNFFAGVQGGTLGIGAEAGYQAFDWLKFRLNANYLPIDFRTKIEEIKYDIDIENLTVGALLDIHPFLGNFRISAGYYYTDFDITLKARPSGSIEIGDNEYDARDVGKLHGSVSWDKWSPYFGIGWGTDRGSRSDFTFDASLGVMRLTGTKIKYGADGPISSLENHPDYQALMNDIDKEADKIKKDVDDYGWYPVITLGFTYKF